MSSVPTTPPASSATYTSRFYTPASTWSSSSFTPSTMASEGPSNVPGTAIALSGSRSTPAASSVSSAATAVSSSAAAGAAALKEASSGNNGGHALALALGLGLGLGLLLLLAILVREGCPLPPFGLTPRLAELQD